MGSTMGDPVSEGATAAGTVGGTIGGTVGDSVVQWVVQTCHSVARSTAVTDPSGGLRDIRGVTRAHAAVGTRGARRPHRVVANCDGRKNEGGGGRRVR